MDTRDKYTDECASGLRKLADENFIRAGKYLQALNAIKLEVSELRLYLDRDINPNIPAALNRVLEIECALNKALNYTGQKGR